MQNKCNNIIKRYKKRLTLMMLQKKNIKEHNPSWPQITDHSHRILIIRGSGSGKINSLFNLISHQPDIEKNFFIC